MAHTVNVNFKLDEDVKKMDGTSLCRDGPFHERRVYDVCKKRSAGSTVFRLRFRLIRSTRKGTSATWKALCRM